MALVSLRGLVTVLLVASAFRCNAPRAVDWRARDRDPDSPEIAGFAPELRAAWTERVIRVDDELHDREQFERGLERGWEPVAMVLARVEP